MIRIKMPLNFRLQNFRFKDGGNVFWTSASKTLMQKFTRWRNRDTSQMCNTSDGYTMPYHGQYISESPDEDGKYYNYKPEYYNHFRTRGFLQGVYEDFAVFGASGADIITVNNLDGEVFTWVYKEYKKWYWKYAEAEGITKDLHGNIWIGISVKTMFGALLNYRFKVP